LEAISQTMQDIFVGVVTCIVGFAFIYGAAANNEFLLNLHKPRWLVNVAGPVAARVFVGVLGVGLIVLGVAIVRGWRLPLFGG
jgi:hypothetical protein